MSETWPVIEVFGPTVQGEGSEAGIPCHFVRFGGCDYRCSWCDSMYAVEPAEVRANAHHLGVDEIVGRLTALDGNPEWVVLSGGNPALLDLTPLIRALQNSGGFKVAVETQGSRWKPWLAEVDRLTVSPKPPSSGMATMAHGQAFGAFMGQAEAHDAPVSLKIVVADQQDYDWARNMLQMYPVADRHLSVCTPQDVPPGCDEREEFLWLYGEISDRYAWLAEKVAGDPALAGVRVLPQLHVIAWGNCRGV
jgi:7-carboxy-7-deazaguanine synthase